MEKAAEEKAKEDGYEIVRMQLEKKGVTLDKSLDDIDPKLLNANVTRLNELLDKYPIVQAYIKKRQCKCFFCKFTLTHSFLTA